MRAELAARRLQLCLPGCVVAGALGEKATCHRDDPRCSRPATCEACGLRMDDLIRRLGYGTHPCCDAHDEPRGPPRAISTRATGA